MPSDVSEQADYDSKIKLKTKLSISRILKFSIVLFLVFTGVTKAQFEFDLDSNKIKAGPEELQRMTGKYYNYSDKNKVNIEVTMIGGPAPGKYLIPEGTTLFDLLVMAGGTMESMFEDIKVVTLNSETPSFKTRTVTEYDYSNLYGTKKEVAKSFQNPVVKPGDLIILPNIKPANPFGAFYYITQITYFLSSLISFYFLLERLVRE